MLNLNTFHTHVGLVPGNVCINMTANVCLLITFLKSILFGPKKKQTKTISEIRVNHSAITKFISLHIFGYIVKHNLLIWVLIL